MLATKCLWEVWCISQPRACGPRLWDASDPLGLGFSNTAAWLDLYPYTKLSALPCYSTLYSQSRVHNELQTDFLQSLISWKSSNVCKAIIHEIEAEQQGFSEMYGRIGPPIWNRPTPWLTDYIRLCNGHYQQEKTLSNLWIQKTANIAIPH